MEFPQLRRLAPIVALPVPHRGAHRQNVVRSLRKPFSYVRALLDTHPHCRWLLRRDNVDDVCVITTGAATYFHMDGLGTLLRRSAAAR